MAEIFVSDTFNVSLRSFRASADTSLVPSLATHNQNIDMSDVPLGANIYITESYITGKVNGAGAYGTNVSTCTVNGQEVRSGGSNSPRTFKVPFQVTSSRIEQVRLAFRFNQYWATDQATIDFTDVGVVVAYEIIQDDEVDNEVLIPQKTVELYSPTETDFTKNGLVLHPIECIVEEEAAGSWELRMEHPFDLDGRWRSLLEECIIKAPVPPYKIPATVIPVGMVYQVKSTVTSTPLYSQLPTYSKADDPGDNSSNYDRWNAYTEYSAGVYCWDYYGSPQEKTIFRSGGTNFGNNDKPGDGGGTWAYVGPLNPSSSNPGTGQGIFNPGVIIRDIPYLTSGNPTQVTFIATYNWKYIKIRDNLGNIGYGIAADYEETSTIAQPYTEPARKIYTQLFRIYDVSSDEAGQVVTVNARHISYDFQHNGVFDCEMTEADPATAIALLQGRLMYNDSRLIACPIKYPLINANWSFRNPIQALLDPDDGLAAQLHAKVLRDNDDFFILPEYPYRIGARLVYGVNLRGVSWNRNSDDIVTRIIPRAGDGNNGYIFLDEMFVDSEHINDYPFPRIEVLDSQYSVGQKIEHANGSKETLNKDAVIYRMRQEARDRFIYDGADSVSVSLDVDFVLMGDTEEYKQYRNLQRINMYDKCEIDTGNTTLTAQVVGYRWDCLMARYIGISIGKVFSQAQKRLPGYRVARGAITYSKLSPGLIKWVKGASS